MVDDDDENKKKRAKKKKKKIRRTGNDVKEKIKQGREPREYQEDKK